MQVLDIDPEWRMHRVSDGQRRRVQICMGLLKPPQVQQHAKSEHLMLPEQPRGEYAACMLFAVIEKIQCLIHKHKFQAAISSCRFFSWMRSRWTWMCWPGLTF